MNEFAMEKCNTYPSVLSLLLWLSLYGHVTHGFILLTHGGSEFGNKNNFTRLNIDDFDLDGFITPIPNDVIPDDSIQSYYKLDDEIVTLIHDTRSPEYKTSKPTSHSYDTSSTFFNQEGYHKAPEKTNTTTNDDIDSDHKMSKDISLASDFGPDEALSKNHDPPYYQDRSDSYVREYNERRQRVSTKYPDIFERQEMIQVPRAVPPTGHSSSADLQDLNTDPTKPRSSRVKRRASVIVRVPPSSRFRYTQPGIRSYVRSSPRKQVRIDAQVGVLVAVDHSVYLQYMKTSDNNHRMAVARIRRYFGMVFALVLPNAIYNIPQMNQRFGTIQDPHLSIKVTISGILIAERRTDAPWTENILNMSTKPYHGRASVDTEKALSGFSKWIAGQEGLPEYDHAMVFTAYRLTNPLGTGLGGMAYLGAVCDTETGKAVSIVGDKGDFQSVRVATHELSHSLGATHDGEGSAKDCKSSDSFIMSTMTSHNKHAPLKNGFLFSKCSIRDMIKHLSKSQSSCILNTPPVYYTYDLERFPPGKTHSPDTQCQLIFGPRSSFCADGSLSSVMCGQLWCRGPNRDTGCRTNSYLTALPGTKCGSHKVCNIGECKLETSRQNNAYNNQSTVINSSNDRKIGNENKINVVNPRPMARIAGFNRPSLTSSRTTGGGRDGTLRRGTPTSSSRRVKPTASVPFNRIGYRDRTNDYTGDRDRHNGNTGNGANRGGGSVIRDNVSDRRRVGGSTSVSNVHRSRTLDRDNPRIVSRGTYGNTNDRDIKDRNVDRNVHIRGKDSLVDNHSNVYRGSSHNRGDAVDDKYNTFNRDSAINRDNIYHRDRFVNRGNTRGSTIRTNRYDNIDTTKKDDTTYRDRIYPRDDTFKREMTFNRNGGIYGSNREINKGSTYSTDRRINRGNIYGGDSRIIRGRTYDRRNTHTRDNSYNSLRKDTRYTRPNNIHRTQPRDKVLYKTVPIDKINPVIGDKRISIRVRGDPRSDINRGQYQDSRITQDSSRSRQTDSRLNRDRGSIREDRLNRENDLTRNGRTKSKLTNSTINIISKGSHNKNELSKPGSTKGNKSVSSRDNSLPKTHRHSKANHRMRKQRRRRQRSRNRGRSGTRRPGRRQRKKNRGKKKKRCLEDKHETYCQGLINVNPEGCRRKAIRQYCCATCRRWRKSKRKSLQPR